MTMPNTPKLPEDVERRFEQQFVEDDLSAIRHINSDDNGETEMEMMAKFLEEEDDKQTKYGGKYLTKLLVDTADGRGII